MRPPPTGSPSSASWQTALEHEAVPDLLPGYSGVLAAGDGTVWAGLYSPDPVAATVWHVYAPAGEWLGGVRMPPGFTPHAIRDGRVAGVWRDSLGVEHVRVYGLR